MLARMATLLMAFASVISFLMAKESDEDYDTMFWLIAFEVWKITFSSIYYLVIKGMLFRDWDQVLAIHQ